MPTERWWRLRTRPAAAVQGRLAFMVRAERRQRAFKQAIVGITILSLVGLIVGTPSGQYVARELMFEALALRNRILGLPPDRQAIEARERINRLRNAASARQNLAKVAAPGSAMALFLQAAGMDAKSAVVRWGNVDRSIVLSSAVFEPDDDRAYRFRPHVRSVWVIGLAFEKVLAMFLIPDTPEARDAAGRVGGRVIPKSVQTTNSWGCRGPEPDTTAPVRVLVLGDSSMQGPLVGDAESPPARLEVHLSRALAAPVSVLNTGHMGYSTEQYAHTLEALGERFRPHYVVISITGNDFGDRNVRVNWDEGEYWIDKMAAYCNERGWWFLLVPGPGDSQLLSNRNLIHFQAQVDRIFKLGGTRYVDPIESFTDVVLRLRNEGVRSGVSNPDPLYNVQSMGDHHYSAVGCDLWARIVARRLLLVWDNYALRGVSCPEPVLRHAQSLHPSIPADAD